MRAFSVFEPPVLPGTLEEDAQSFVFVRHGWSLGALLVPLIWMVIRRLWWVLLAYVILVAAIQIASFAVPSFVTGGLSVALAIIIMLEAGQLRLESMAVKGYREIAIVDAKNQREAEQKFFTLWLAERGQTFAEKREHGHVLRPTSAAPPALPGLPS